MTFREMSPQGESLDKTTEAMDETTEAMDKTTEAMDGTTEAMDETTEAMDGTTEAMDGTTEAMEAELPWLDGSRQVPLEIEESPLPLTEAEQAAVQGAAGKGGTVSFGKYVTIGCEGCRGHNTGTGIKIY